VYEKGENMEYIQCPHCGKQYDVSDRIREAEGKTAGCKACGEKFKIKIISEDVAVSTHKTSTEPARCIACNNMQDSKHNFAGKHDPTNHKLLPGNEETDYLCPHCMKSFKLGKLAYPSDSSVDVEAPCMVCSKKRGYNHNYAGQINEIKGNLFPGDPSTDYLCNKCKVKLEGGTKPSHSKNKTIGKRQKQSKDLAAGNELVLLITPIIGFLLTWTWIGNMALISNPASSLNLLIILVVVVTAIGISMEVSKSEADLKTKGMHSPIEWFIFTVLLWIVVYPYYLAKRKDYGYTGRGLVGVLVTILFLVSFIGVSMAIEEKKDEIRQMLSGTSSRVSNTLQNIQNKVASDSVSQYNMAKRQGNKIQICVQAGMVSAAYLQANDDYNYNKWKAIEESDCSSAGL